MSTFQPAKPIITWQMLRARRACYSDKRLQKVFGEGLTALEICRLDVPVEDRLWALLDADVLGEKCLHHLACDFAEHVPQKSPKSVEALRVKRLWIEGQATDEEREIASAVAAAYAAYAAAAASEYTAYAAASAVGAVADAEIEWQLHQIESRLIEED